MEKGRVLSLSMICLLLIVTVNRPTAAAPDIAGFGLCYGSCYPGCLLLLFIVSEFCPVICLVKCFTKLTTVRDVQSFCELGCATINCSGISTGKNPATKEVKKCVGDCSVACTKKN
ncbi:hypothetical protein V6N13_017743 [Hibiscus sabdariffa]